jgi:Uma2 family endonuclease
MTSHAQALPPNPAPWAEIVPNAPRMTVADLKAWPDDGWHYELVDGMLVRMPLSSGGASHLAMRLAARLEVYVEDHDLGAVTGEAGGYDFSALGQPDTELGPDVAFVRAEHVPDADSPEYNEAWPVAPDLVVEVASPYQWRPKMALKAQRYLAAGVRLVWVIWPRWKQVDIWHPGETTPAALSVGDVLQGEDVVPGFTYPVARLFS